MASSDLFTSPLSEGTITQAPPADALGRDQDSASDLGEAAQPGEWPEVVSTTQLQSSGAVCRSQDTATDFGEATPDHEVSRHFNSPRVEDIKSLTAAMLTITRCLFGVI